MGKVVTGKWRLRALICVIVNKSSILKSVKNGH